MRPILDKPCRIMVAPNGARRLKSDHPALPITPIEIAETAKDCLAAGATAIHLHARDGRGRHTLARHIYESYLLALRRAVGERMTIQITTEAVGQYAPDDQINAVKQIKPEAVSLALRELLPDEQGEQKAAEFFGWLDQNGIATQYIVYNPEEITWFFRLCRRGIIPNEHRSLLFVLGRYLEPNQVVEPTILRHYLDACEEEPDWMVCAFGKEETACLTAAICLGGNVRVGFENSLWLGNGRLARDNAEKVAELCEIADRVGRKRQLPPT